MLKTLSIYATCLLSLPLAAETIGNVEFQFPPSNFEWKLLADDHNRFCDDDGKEEFSIDEDEDFPCENEQIFKFFTHREGDALELFIATQMPDTAEDDDEDDEPDTLFSLQKRLDETLNQYFPNHKLILLNVTNNCDEGFAEWELNDGAQDVMHGYSRAFKKNGSLTVLCYLTTAVRTESNRFLWTQVLDQVKIIE